MAIQSTIMLNNGTVIPQVGLGVFQTPDGDTTVNAVQTALENGYTHIANAKSYMARPPYRYRNDLPQRGFSG